MADAWCGACLGVVGFLWVVVGRFRMWAAAGVHGFRVRGELGSGAKPRGKFSNRDFEGFPGLVERRELQKWIARTEISLLVGFGAMAVPSCGILAGPAKM